MTPDETGDDSERPDLLSMSFRERARLAFRQDPTRGVVVLLLLLFGLGFLLAFFVVFGGELLDLLGRLLAG